MLKTPKKLYTDRLNKGAIQEDSKQKLAVESLETLYQSIISLHEISQKGGIQWGQLLGFKAKTDIPQGLYMYGGVGRGKSMLMDLFYDCVPDNFRKQRVHFHKFMIDVHDYIHSRRDADNIREGVDAALPMLSERIYERSRLLCFDEFHVTDITDAMILGRLFRHLFERGVIVVATSNWQPDRLYEGGLQRDRFLPFIDLLKQRMRVFHLDSDTDYRKEFLAAEGTYFHPLGVETQNKINNVFKHLINNETPYDDALEIKGRTIPVPSTACGVARFSFCDLCEKPLGAEDYLAIARTYHTIILENIPILKYDRRNEAKRLMNLIDALYEARTKLIVTAQCPAESLYEGQDHAYEFERTISRLNEMQSAEYLED